MARLYNQLKTQMANADIDQIYLASCMRKSQTYITNRMTGRYPWTADDMYQIMDILNYPYERMYELFPKDGKNINFSPATALSKQIIAETVKATIIALKKGIAV